MRIVECDQLSARWFQEHKGRVTASSAALVLDFLKSGKESEKRADYKARKVAELLTGVALEDHYVSKDMEYGIEQEPFARAAYETRYGVDVEEVGFVIHPTIERAGSSPDGLVSPNGGIEIKCARAKNHIRWMLADVVPPEHEVQMAFNMSCAEAEWWDFVSFCPIMPRPLRLFVKRLPRDEQRIAEIEAAVIQFLAEVDALVARLNALAPPEAILDAQLKASLDEMAWTVTDDDIRAVEPTWKGTA